MKKKPEKITKELVDKAKNSSSFQEILEKAKNVFGLQRLLLIQVIEIL